jgi:hypothetical protein
LKGAIAALACACACRGVDAPIARDWTYDVEVAGDELRVDARAGTRDRDALHVDEDARAYVRDVRVDGDRVRYRFALGEAARAIDDADVAERFGDAIVAPASAWLLHPSGAARSYRVRVRGFALSGLSRGADGVFEAAGAGLDDTPYFAFGAWRHREALVAGARLTVGIASPLAIDDAAIHRAIVDAATSLAEYLHGFARRDALVLVVPAATGAGVDGKTLGGGGRSVLLRVARDASADLLRESWVPTHELVHASLPSFGPEHRWLEEGIATYVEPIVRARAGVIPSEHVWRDLVESAPKGLPSANDEGLERTRSWGRTYWGGAVFCLAADVEIRARTSGARSFDDVLRAMVATGASVAERWDVERFLAIADDATGTHVVRELFQRLALAPGRVDLDAMWRELGVRAEGGTVVLDDAAPRASIRRAITAR